MNLNCSEERLSSGASIFLSLWFSLSGLAAVVGNATVLGILYKKESLRTISNRFLASLSVADFFVGLVLSPIFLATYLSQPQSGHGSMTKIIKPILWIHSAGATSLSLCCASVDRLIAIRFPYRYQEFVTKMSCGDNCGVGDLTVSSFLVVYKRWSEVFVLRSHNVSFSNICGYFVLCFYF